ncbi:1577_t:CDS:2, partial [Cetraspora pellucida]
MFNKYQHLHLAICEMFLKELLMPSYLEYKDLIKLKSFCQLLKLFETNIFILFKVQSNSISEAITVILEIAQYINKHKFEYLKETLIEIDRYSETSTKLFVKDIQHK